MAHPCRGSLAHSGEDYWYIVVRGLTPEHNRRVLDWHNEILPLSRPPQGGEAKTILIPNIALETQPASGQKRTQAHTLSIWRGASGHADQPRQSG